jgi:hypothetical protein
MENREFLHHLNIIKKLIKNPYIRIILLHTPYTEKQQMHIDSFCRRSLHIIGQIERKPPFKDVSEEIKRLISADHDPLIRADKIQYVVLGRQKRDN